MNLSAFLYPFYLFGLFLFIMSLTSARLSIVLELRDDIFAYRVTGSILKYITVFTVKSGVKKEGRWRKVWKGKKNKEGKYLNILKNVLEERKLRLIDVERLVLEGTYSIGDAAVNAILYGVFMALWQFFLIYLNEHFKLKHQSFRLKPDFQNDRIDLKFQIILRAAVFKIVWMIFFYVIKTHKHRGKEFNKSEYFYT